MGLFGRFWVKKAIEEPKIEYDAPVIGFETMRSGGMQGGTHRIEIIAADKYSNALICDSLAPTYQDDPIEKEYLVSSEIFGELKAIYDKYDMKDWGSLPNRKAKISDAPVTTYKFIFDDNSLNFSTDQELPARFFDAREEITEIIERYRAK